MTISVEENLVMVHGSAKGINEVAPGRVMLNLQRGSRYEIEVVCNGLRPVPESQHMITGLVPDTFTRLITLILSFIPYKTKKDWFMTSNPETIRYYVEVMRYIRKRKPAIAIVHVSYSVCWLIKWISPATEVVYYHHGGNMHIKLSHKLWSRLVNACPKLIISVTQFAIDGCRAKYKTFPEKMVNIHNGIEGNTKTTSDVNKLSLWGKENVFVYCYAGHLTFSKGVDIIIKSFYLAAAKSEEARLLLIGGPDLEMDDKANDLISLVNSFEEEIRNRILITGKMPNKKAIDYISSSDVAVLASQVSEGNSIFAIESMHCGLPILTTAITGNYELSDPDFPNCLFIEVSDHQIEQMAQQMELLRLDDNLYHEMSQNALKRAREHFTLDRMVREFDDTLASTFSL